MTHLRRLSRAWSFIAFLCFGLWGCGEQVVPDGPANSPTGKRLIMPLASLPMGPSFTADQIAKLLASDGAADDEFGVSVALSGTTAIVGAYGKNGNVGAAYVFVRENGSWNLQAKMVPSDAGGSDCFGYSVAISGDTAIVGAYNHPHPGMGAGAAYVYVRNSGLWMEQAELLPADGELNKFFGRAVAISGDTAVLTAPGDDDSGALSGSAYVFTRNGTTWTQQQKLLAFDGAAGDFFGNSVALSEDTTIVGAAKDDAQAMDSGSAYVFTRNGVNWTLQQKLVPSMGFVEDNFGHSVAISGESVLVGAVGHDDGMVDSGAAYVFVRSGTTWTQQDKLVANFGLAGDAFGYSVALEGNLALVGAVNDDDKGAESGSVTVLSRSAQTWTRQTKWVASDGIPNAGFGNSVALSGSSAIVGAAGDSAPMSLSGSAYVFALRLDLGYPCTDAAQCASGFCADGVCCDSSCNGNACVGCSIAKGALSDGSCAPLTGTPCDDDDLCTTAGTCNDGVCVGIENKNCSTSSVCRRGDCDPSSGNCVEIPLADNTPCEVNVSGILLAGKCVASGCYVETPDNAAGGNGGAPNSSVSSTTSTSSGGSSSGDVNESGSVGPASRLRMRGSGLACSVTARGPTIDSVFILLVAMQLVVRRFFVKPRSTLGAPRGAMNKYS